MAFERAVLTKQPPSITKHNSRLRKLILIKGFALSTVPLILMNKENYLFSGVCSLRDLNDLCS